MSEYRSFAPDQGARAETIRSLRATGMGLEQIAELLENPSDHVIAKTLHERRDETYRGPGANELMMTSTPLDELLDAVESERRADLETIDEVIAQAAPGLKRQLLGGPSITMIGYGESDWQRPSGRGVWPLVGMASQKQYISLYVAAERDGVAFADHYREALGRTNNGKNCIRFRTAADIDLDVLAQTVRRRRALGRGPDPHARPQVRLTRGGGSITFRAASFRRGPRSAKPNAEARDEAPPTTPHRRQGPRLDAASSAPLDPTGTGLALVRLSA